MGWLMFVWHLYKSLHHKKVHGCTDISHVCVCLCVWARPAPHRTAPLAVKEPVVCSSDMTASPAHRDLKSRQISPFFPSYWLVAQVREQGIDCHSDKGVIFPITGGKRPSSSSNFLRNYQIEAVIASSRPGGGSFHDSAATSSRSASEGGCDSYYLGGGFQWETHKQG